MGWVFRFALLLAFMLAAAPSRATTPWLPAQGPYWSPSADGTYYHVSVGPDGFLFVAVTLYRTDGAPTFLVMQGPFEPTPLAEWAASGVTGRLRSPLYRMSGGSCIGCADARTAQTVASGFGDAEIEFRNDGRAVFRHAGHETAIEHYPLYNDASSLPRNRLAGRWQVRYVGDTDAGPADITAVVEIGARTGVRATPGGPSDAGLDGFRADELLSIDCVDCRRAETLIPLPNVFAAKDDGTLRLYGAGCARIVCFNSVGAIVHERDGALIARSVGARVYEMTLRRLGDRCGPHFDDCQQAYALAPAETVPWLPPAGLFWDGTGDGAYYHVGVGPGGFLFVAITTYDGAGEPTFLVMQGAFESSSLSQWSASGEIGRLRSPLYRMSGGQPLDGAYRSASVAPSELGGAEIVFRSGGRAELRRSGTVTALVTYPLYTGAAGLPDNRLQGRWVMALRRAGVAYASGLVDIAPTGVANRLGVACVDCDFRTAFALGLHAELLIDDDGLRLEGFPAYASPARFDLHERDGTLYGRRPRAELAGVHPDLQFALNTDIVLMRIGPRR